LPSSTESFLILQARSRNERRTKRKSSVVDWVPTTKPLTLAEFSAALAGIARWEQEPFLAVAVSGGADSLALTLLADRWARQRGGQICAVTVDHRLRPESGEEIRRLQGWLSARAIRHEILPWSGDKPLTGIQEAARSARYALLDDWCRAHGCLHLLTAHHREDQAETYLMRRRAGSGANGLAGMSAIRELSHCRVVRPLLGVAKRRLVMFLDAERQPFITDPSNSDPAFERSRLRNEGSLPVEHMFGALLNEIRTFAYERQSNEGKRHLLLAQSVNLHPAGFGLLDPAPLVDATPDASEAMLGALTATIGGRGYSPRRSRIARLRELLITSTRHGYTLGGCQFVAWRDRILVVRELAAAAQPLTLSPGAHCMWDSRFCIALPATAGSAMTVGYLGGAGVAGLGRLLQKSSPGGLPRLIYPTLPAVWDEHGLAAVPHLGYRREDGMVLPEVRFRPANPLTRAGFTVV
jgi:tRNA(Ile)-lysidine synthase